MSNTIKVRWFPFHSTVEDILPLLEGVPKRVVGAFLRDIWQRTGTYSSRVDWSEPDKWIPEKLSGDSETFAWEVWKGTKGRVNPRHIYGSYLFINHYELVWTDSKGSYHISDTGTQFLNDELQALGEMDRREGLLFLLNLVALRGRSKYGDLLPEWAEYLREHSSWRGAEMVRDSLKRRLANLVDRGFIKGEASVYNVCTPGIDYFTKISSAGEANLRADVFGAVSRYNGTQRELIKQRLSEMSPRGFEFFISGLLEAMGYEDVQVTPPTGDKGVDVKATIHIGTTPVIEVFQLKRTRHRIGRRVLDELRGALVHHDATIGTIITLGEFTRGCLEASSLARAARIGLIDGGC